MHEPKERLQKNILIMVFENLIFNIGTNVALAYNVYAMRWRGLEAQKYQNAQN